MGIMTLAGVIQPAIGIEHRTQGVSGREVVFGTIDGKHRQALPRELIPRRPDLVGEARDVTMELFESGPGELGPGFGDGAPVDGFGVWPQTAPSRQAEKGPHLAVDALTLATGRQGQQENDQAGQRELAPANKCLR